MWVVVPKKGSYNTDFMKRIYEDETGTYAEMDDKVVRLSEKAVMCDILNGLDAGLATTDVDASWMR